MIHQPTFQEQPHPASLSFRQASITAFDAIILFGVWAYLFLSSIDLSQKETIPAFLINTTLGVVFWHEYFHFLTATVVAFFIRKKKNGVDKKKQALISTKTGLPQTVSSLFQILAVLYFFLFPAGLYLGFFSWILEPHWSFLLTPPGLMFLELIVGSLVVKRAGGDKEVIGLRFIHRIKSLTVNVPIEIFFQQRWVRVLITASGYLGSFFIGMVGLLNLFGTSDVSFSLLFATSCLHLTLGASTLLLGLIPLSMFRFQDGASLIEKVSKKDMLIHVGNTCEDNLEAGRLLRDLATIRNLFIDFGCCDDEREKAKEAGEKILDEFAKLRGDFILSKYDPKKHLQKVMDKYSQKNSVTNHMIKKVSDLFDDMERAMRAVHPELMGLMRPHPNNPWARGIQWSSPDSAQEKTNDLLRSLEQTLDSGNEEEIAQASVAIPGVMKLAVSDAFSHFTPKPMRILEKCLQNGPGGTEWMLPLFTSFYIGAGYPEKLEPDLPIDLKRALAVKIGLTSAPSDYDAEQFPGVESEILDWAFPERNRKDKEETLEKAGVEVAEKDPVPHPRKKDLVKKKLDIKKIGEPFAQKNDPLTDLEIEEIEEVWMPMVKIIVSLKKRLGKERMVVALGGYPGKRRSRIAEVLHSILNIVGETSEMGVVLIRMAGFSMDKLQLEAKNIPANSPEAFDVPSFARCIESLKSGKAGKKPQWKPSTDPDKEGPYIRTGKEIPVPPAQIIIAEGTYVLKKDVLLDPLTTDTDVNSYSLLQPLFDLSLFVAKPKEERMATPDLKLSSKNADLILEEWGKETMETLSIPHIGKRFKLKGFQWRHFFETLAKWKKEGRG